MPPSKALIIRPAGAGINIRSGVTPRAQQENWRYCELNDVGVVSNVSFPVVLPTRLIMARTVPCKHVHRESLKRFAIRNLETGALCQGGS